MRLLPALLLTLPVGAQDEPPAPRGLVARAEGAYDGYTLYSPLRERTTYLVDMGGEVVHTWRHTENPGNTVYLLDDGSLLRACKVQDPPVFRGGGQGGRIERIAWDGSVTWSYTLADEAALHHHDFEVLPSGNLLLIAWELRTREEAVAAGRDPDALGDDGLWPDWVLEIEPTGSEGGEVVWEWHAWDHLIQDHDPDKANYGDVTAHPERIDINADHRDAPPLSEADRKRQAEVDEQMRALGYTGDDEDEGGDDRGDRRRRGGDWLHTNGIDHDPERDLIVLSVRSLSEVWVIDHSTTTEQARGSSGGSYGRGGDLVWRWGNPRNYGAGKGRDRRLFVQHDARFVPAGWPGEGNITIYNNGEGRPGARFSSVEEVSLVLDDDLRPVRGARDILEPLEATWTHGYDEQGRFFSSFISGAERLPNGNTLVTVGAEGRIFEVTTEGEVVWDYLVPFAEGAEEGSGGRRGGPPGGDRPPRGEGRPERGAPPPGGPPGRGGRGDRGDPGERGDRGRGGRGGPGGPGGLVPSGVHRAGRVSSDHPGLADKGLGEE